MPGSRYLVPKYKTKHNMQEDPASVFSQPEFKASLAKYEQMIQDGIHVYFEAEELTLIAEYYANAGDMKSSEEAIDYAISLHPENLDVQIYKCHTLFSHKKIQEAQQLLYSLPDQNDYEVRLLYTELALIQGDAEKAKRLFEQCYEENPYIETLFDIGQLYLDYRMKNEAYPWILKAFKQEPENPEAIELMASFQYMSENWPEAEKLYNRLLDEFPYNIDTWLNLSKCHYQQGQIEQAIEALDFALAIDDTSLFARELKAHCYLDLGESEKALQCLGYIESHTKDKPYIWDILTRVHFELGNYEEVLEYSNKLLAQGDLPKESDKTGDIYFLRIMAYMFTGGVVDATMTLRDWFRIDTEDYRAYILEGELLMQLEKYEDARDFFTHAIKICPDPKAAFTYIATVFFRNSFFQEALDIYQELEAYNPSDTEHFSYSMAYCHFRLNHKEEMLMYLVRGSVYTPEVMKGQGPDFDLGYDEIFFRLGADILHKIEQGEIDPTPFLNKKA